MKSKTVNSQQFDLYFAQMLEDYVTAIAWSPQGKFLATSSAAGEVIVWEHTPDRQEKWQRIPLQTSQDQSVDCLAFSSDGHFLAAGGQAGVKIWQRDRDTDVNQWQLLSITHPSAWVDRLAWNPLSNQLAFSLGRTIQIWDATTPDTSTTLNFAASSVLGLDWSSDGQYLAIAGYHGVKIWESRDWNEDPYIFDLPTASVAIAWAGDSKYFAIGNMDRTIAVFEWNNPNPWVMRGFPGKIRQITWSTANQNPPLFAAASVEGVVVWSKHPDDLVGWESQVLQHHLGVIQAIAFQPNSLLLASAAEDGLICLWHKAQRLAQILEGAPQGFSCLAWHPQGQHLAAGGHNGELHIWIQSRRGQGFNLR
ncbi:WD40 repeat domain-containing protein [Chroogloeocystis siderophila]|jgi:WD40 repeat protein|uniref:Uncharacterized protein n=1 Tax=Chroogloeocystis siderophila 5.2 s.c.1 TaxID=247279 RepID=A0A1U7HWP6_9CHRO|nr:WD40 repeat domain-containing protein [Chroogloeocystis siderophila]OKH27982.1 hypothetical protein NIES1031_05210 [Chroogloeocystis siderophila 5.2 s.c.1]